MNGSVPTSGEAEAVVIVKAAPQLGQRHGETVCSAEVDLQGNWLRLYPVAFRTLDEGRKFGRWDRIRFRWRLPNDDPRPESRRVDQDSIRITGELKPSERQRFLAARIVTGLKREREANRSLALLRPRVLGFSCQRKSEDEMAKDTAAFAALHNQADLFNTKPLIPSQPCPFPLPPPPPPPPPLSSRVPLREGGRRSAGHLPDWEIEATFYNWHRSFGEERALA